MVCIDLLYGMKGVRHVAESFRTRMDEAGRDGISSDEASSSFLTGLHAVIYYVKWH